MGVLSLRARTSAMKRANSRMQRTPNVKCTCHDLLYLKSSLLHKLHKEVFHARQQEHLLQISPGEEGGAGFRDLGCQELHDGCRKAIFEYCLRWFLAHVSSIPLQLFNFQLWKDYDLLLHGKGGGGQDIGLMGFGQGFFSYSP